MVDVNDVAEEHSGVNPISSSAERGTSVSREEFNVALDTLKTSMTTEIKGMFKEFLDDLKLSMAPLEVVDPTNKVTDANSDKGELLVIKFICLVVKVETASLPMLNHLSLMEDRFPPHI